MTVQLEEETACVTLPLFVTALAQAFVVLCLQVGGNGGGSGTRRLGFPVSRLLTDMHRDQRGCVTQEKSGVQQSYPRMPSSTVALYWMGISMRAARAKAASFSAAFALLPMISVKLTNCIVRATEAEDQHSMLSLGIDARRRIPGNCRNHALGSCRQTSSCHPMVRRQLQQAQSIMDKHCQLQR